MKKSLRSKAILCLIIAIVAIILFQGFSLAKSENTQMIKKGENEYILYVSNLLNEDFEFAFSNDLNADKATLAFHDSAMDQQENGNHIAYVDSEIYTQYFKDKTNTYLWVKQGETYKLEAEEIKLKNALSENEIQNFNSITKLINVEIKEKELPVENEDGVKVTHKIGTINIKEEAKETYSYKIVKVVKDTDTARFIELAKKMNELTDKNMYEKLSTYQEFKEVYSKVVPKLDDAKWTKVANNTIEQPKDSKKGDQYLVWIKDSSKVDVQIMTCEDEYTQTYEKQDVVIKETTKLPVLGDSIILFVVLGIVILLIVVVAIIKLKNKKETK